MSELPSADFVQSNFRFSGANYPQVMEVCLGWDISGYGGTLAGVANDLEATFVSEMTPGLFATNLAMKEILVKQGPNATGPSVLKSSGYIGSGGAGGGAAVSVLMKKNTAVGGRHGRGRAYWPGAPEAQVDQGGLLAGATVSAWEGALADFFAVLSGLGIEPVLLHGDATAPTPQTSITVSNMVATQRRRQRR